MGNTASSSFQLKKKKNHQNRPTQKKGLNKVYIRKPPFFEVGENKFVNSN